MSKFAALLLLLPGLLGSLSRAQTNPYESDIRAFEQQDLRNPPPANSILFLGSSTIVRWDRLAAAFPRFNVLNRGFGGSQASDVLFFYDRLVPPYRPPLIVFYEGDNDLAGGKSVAQVFADWTNFVGRVDRDLPEAHVLFVSVKPSPSRASLLPKVRELNDRIRAFNALDPKLHFADVFTPMLNSDGQPRPELFVSDMLHLNSAGYDVWEAAIVPAVEDWAARSPVNVMRVTRNSLLIDLGAEGSTSGAANAIAVQWNNVTAAGLSSGRLLTNIVATSGTPSPLGLEMVSRFNGANENGTTAASQFPASATRDSLFGNTEIFSGLANVTPVFRVTGLDPAANYDFLFYASRLGVSDNRETRYTVTGAGTQSADLNAANNVDGFALINGVQPAGSGTVTIALTPGPNNNNANHFTYLGVLRIQASAPGSPGYLFDFGSASAVTETQAPPPGAAWNNLTPAAGGSDDGRLENLVAANGVLTEIDLQMIARFNGANENGTTGTTNFPASATRDSLFGNTETFNGLESIAPAFKLAQLDPAGVYALRFFASRTGVSDNRETIYTVAGAATATAVLDAANNVEGTAVVEGMRPDAKHEITISLSPGPNNNNANHFTYLGALEVSWTAQPLRDAALLAPAFRPASSEVAFDVVAEEGLPYSVQVSTNLKTWSGLGTTIITNIPGRLQFPAAGDAAFFRLVRP